MNKNICFLGAGNMGGALIEGAIRKGFLDGDHVAVFDVDGTKSTQLKDRLKVKTAGSVRQAMEGCHYIFLCVKPQQMDDLLEKVFENAQENQCFVSIAAGITTERIKESLKLADFSPRIVRVMPNTPAMVGQGMSVIAEAKYAKPEDIEFCKSFFSAVGEVAVLNEKYFDAVTALSGSGPAYLFYLAEAFERAAGELLELPPEKVTSLVRAVIKGSATLLDGKESAAELRRKVTSPGGTTEAAIQHLESQNWQQIFVDAIRKAKERSKELRNAQSK